MKILIKKTWGFSLLELMIVIAVIAITLAWAIPSYQDSVRKARRGEAQSLMRQAEVCAARWFTVNATFVGLEGDDDCEPKDDDYYTYTFSSVIQSAYIITAAPQGSQIEDKCGTMTMDQTGTTEAAATGCWLSGQTSR
ncbi:MAG: type IV pilin protein [Xanthomonadales bacterium]|nr:type IV pilin protein [Xanthomonadales bacterium]